MKQLKEFRDKKNLTQQQIAIKLNVSPSYYIKVEQGNAKAGKGLIDKFIKAFPDDRFEILSFFYPEESTAGSIGGETNG